MLDQTEHELLPCKGVATDDQDVIRSQLDLPQYRSHPDPWKRNYRLTNNFILAMYSKREVARLMDSSTTHDYVVYARPDTLQLAPITCAMLKRVSSNISSNTVCVQVKPKYRTPHGPFNDRFAICSGDAAASYGCVCLITDSNAANVGLCIPNGLSASI